MPRTDLWLTWVTSSEQSKQFEVQTTNTKDPFNKKYQIGPAVQAWPNTWLIDTGSFERPAHL